MSLVGHAATFWFYCNSLNLLSLSPQLLCYILGFSQLNLNNFLFFVAAFSPLLKSSRPDAFCKNVFLEISQNSQENTCARVSFLMKLQAWGLHESTFVSDSCWFVSDSCWLVLMIRVGLVLIRVDLCWFVLIRVDPCWYSCIKIELIIIHGHVILCQITFFILLWRLF